MYLNFFGFHKKPFSVTPDPSFFFPSESHRQGLAHLRYGIRERVGFIALTGEVGTGKTHLVRMLLQELGPEVKRALILNPVLNPDDLLTAIMQDLDITFDPTMGLRERLEAFVGYLIKEHQQGHRVLIIIDESHNLSIQALERLRLLSNLETAGTKLVQILLVGQPELNLLLKLPPLRSLNQRISVRHHLECLTSKDTAEYIRHRLVVAGGQGVEVVFTQGATRLIHRASRGIPRVVSTLCDFCLVIAFTAESSRITPKIAREAIRLFRSKSIPSEPRRMEQTYRRRALVPALAGCLALILGLGLTGWNLLKEGNPTSSKAPITVATPSFLSTSADGPGTPFTPEPILEPSSNAFIESAMTDGSHIPQAGLSREVESLASQSQEISSFLVETNSSPVPAIPSPSPRQEQHEPILGGAISPVPSSSRLQPDLPEEPPLSAEVTDPWNSLPEESAPPLRTNNPVITGGKRFGVQIASTKSIEKARSAAKRVTNFGPVYVVPTTSAKGEKWIKVVVGAMETYDEAASLAKKLNETGKAKDGGVVRNNWWNTHLSGDDGVIVVEPNPRVADSSGM